MHSSNLKKYIVIFCMLCSFAIATILDDCYKIYPVDADTLYLKAVGAIAASDRFEISELQTRNGYILFTYGSRYYLLTVTKRYKNQTEIKILPQNSDYSQGSSVANSVFLLIDAELKKPLEQAK